MLPALAAAPPARPARPPPTRLSPAPRAPDEDQRRRPAAAERRGPLVGAGEASDEDLLGRAADGDMGAFELLVERWGALVVAALERLVGDHHTALDAAQDVWIKVHRNLAKFERGAKVRPWLFAIALNHGRDVLRRRARRPDQGGAREELDDGVLRAPAAAEHDRRTLERGAIAATLALLDEKFREALVMVDALGVGYDEAAGALGLSIGTLKSRVHRGRVAFRELWAASEARGARAAEGANTEHTAARRKT